MGAFLLTVTLMVTSLLSSMTSAETDYDRVKHLETMVSDLSRQAMLQQFFLDERMRSQGQSGVKAVHQGHVGTRPYFGVSFQDGNKVAGIYDLPHVNRLVGHSEATYILNGVQFRSGSDYHLSMPSTQSTTLHAEEEIPFPDVPPSVLHKSNVNQQIQEMREYFKAFLQQTRRRDYHPYFKPVLCYLEGAWFINSHYDAAASIVHHSSSSFLKFEEKRLKAMEAGEGGNNMFGYTPTLIYNVTNGIPQFAQWKSRIACHPLSRDVPLRYLHPLDDLAPRIARRMNQTQFKDTAMQRFSVSVRSVPGYEQWGLLDDLMYEVPGKDNYPGNLSFSDFGQEFFRTNFNNMTHLHGDRYSRWYKVADKGAMGTKNNHRFFSDPTLFAALTSQPDVAPLRVTHCETEKGHKVCRTFQARMTYAIPLEIVFLSPLYNWNPHNLDYKPPNNVTHGGRHGGFDPATAYDGFSNSLFFHTPVEFFNSSKLTEDPNAPMDRRVVGVLDKHNHVRKVVASGTRIFLPDIPGLGPVRMRYPILPVHQEGNAIWRELDALKDMLSDVQKYQGYF